MEQNNNNNIDWGGWVFTIVMLAVFWPVGLVLLFRQLMGNGKQEHRSVGGVKRHPYDLRQETPQGTGRQAPPVWQTPAQQPTKAAAAKSSGKKSGKTKGKESHHPVDVSKGKVLTIIGACLAGVFGIGLLSTIGEILSYGWFSYYLEDLAAIGGFFGAGLVCLYAGRQRNKQARRYKKYLAYIGKNTTVSIHTLANAMGVKEKTVCEDLQAMLDTGVLPVGYLDLACGKLVLSDEGISEPEAQPAPEPEPAREEKDENAILQEIRAVNDAIPDEAMSAKIDRIGEITGKILDYQRSHPSMGSQLRSFLNYYLPTTLKILRAYAQLDAQGIEGENINAAKARIEGMMDQVVAGFEKQLDKLFQDDALDITSDVEVLEKMLKKDGLAGESMSVTDYRPNLTLEVTDFGKGKDASGGGQGLTLGG